VVEDSRDMTKYIATVLGGRYTVLNAANGVEGLSLAEQYVPDLVITDVMMPEKDGYALTADLRNSVATSHIPVVMLTARATLEDKLEGLGVGADAYLPKPFDERELLVTINTLLESRARLRETYSNAMASGGEAVDNPNIIFLNRLSLAVGSHLDDSSWFPGGLADEMCLSRSQLDRKLRAMTGHSVFSFLMRMRLQRARQMLMQGHGNMSEIAAACGFSDPAHFSRSFKSEFGVSPSQFMKKT
jgi:YesN/AraC family two-component response regulator